ncbi:RpiR family transcriptional regulator [Defluviimonas denitrificans]|jgi:DNA-binding MurR/RpiR family transcriptional regulator|uniref:RpiR family transcriptional regulator n=1 Tax=Albidovulum denitrificans TaxID=404881 RepID=A0A2S8S5I5_9RHOB|nr:MurR/RpiR family transcriptional regulator [Defluviimonas denitrificans]PQV56062.1 RpiR family transcriptional regulator [Defluviimonas denitrificans]
MQVRDRIERVSGEMTATERRLSAAILVDYPFAGLEPIQEIAQKTNTSPPTISRFVTKLGFHGFQDFQRSLISELKERQRSPVDLQRTAKPVDGAYLQSFLARASKIIEQTGMAIPEAQFERICGLLSDPRRAIYVIGGRMSDTIASYMSRHLRQTRAKVYHLPTDPEMWPEYLLRMKPRDILFVADFRRYQKNLERLAERAVQDRKVLAILLTDRWLSPVSQHATEVLAVPIESNTLWDSYSGAFSVVEAALTRIAETNWKTVKARIEDWDSLRLDFGETEEDDL